MPKKLFWNILVNTDGSVDVLKMKCLKPKCGFGNIIDDTSNHLPKKMLVTLISSVIVGHLVVTLKDSSQFEVKNYKHVEIFNQVKKN